MQDGRIKYDTFVQKLLDYAISLPDFNYDKDLLHSFLYMYFEQVYHSDLVKQNNKELWDMACSHWQQIQKKKKQFELRLFSCKTIDLAGGHNYTVLELTMDDMPFVVDSIRMELIKQGFQVHSFINVACVHVVRDKAGVVKALFQKETSDSVEELFLRFHLSWESDQDKLSAIDKSLNAILTDVSIVVADWREMQKKMHAAVDTWQFIPSKEYDDLAEVRAFFDWLLEYFTFLGCRKYLLKTKKGVKELQLIKASGLGVLRDASSGISKRIFTETPSHLLSRLDTREVFYFTKTNTKSTIHRSVYTDLVGMRYFNEAGEVVGEYRFVGLLTSDAYDSDPTRIPLIRRKVYDVIKHAQLRSRYSKKMLLHIMKTLPREELFQASFDQLYSLSLNILNLQDRRCVKLFVREDIFSRFVACLVYLPRDDFATETSNKIETILDKEFGGLEMVVLPSYSESMLASVYYVIRVDPKNRVIYNLAEIEKKIISVVKSWRDEFNDSLYACYGQKDGQRYYQSYHKVFPAVYREQQRPEIAVLDVRCLASLTLEHNIEICIYKLENIVGMGLKIFRLSEELTLSDLMPILKNMGMRTIREQRYCLEHEDKTVYISDFTLVHEDGGELDVGHIRDQFREGFSKVIEKAIDNDRFNALVMRASLTYSQVVVLRAYAKYLKLIGYSLSQAYIRSCMLLYPELVKLLIELFEERFKPDRTEHSDVKVKAIRARLVAGLVKVQILDHDRIFRRFIDLILATVRTNYFLDNRETLVFKFELALIPEMPKPVPLYEGFVYSVRVEGVHLRSDKVARGGIRWSDRFDDYRTEVLGLMKAQQVKNSIIVPGGAKGGFVCKQLSTDASVDEMKQQGRICYEIFINSLLQITDNHIDNKVMRPKNIVCYDDEDPYFVVAPDKGTATFSDLANALSIKNNFWLDDAFASGGSDGYDHKKMGITARGAWEAVKCHFRQLKIDINSPFTVVGIGDMSGDVFGNGMLLSNKIKLVAAFNHRLIFIDPNPNSESSFLERKRLFQLDGGDWDKYNQDLVSKGGGVYLRRQKYVKLSPQAQKVLGVEIETVSTDYLIKCILLSPVDLLWHGGIGTYAKASQEQHVNVGDPMNDGVRVDASQLRCKVIAEGGNLGFTQLARIEYARRGGINTDFIDNSGGVDCSDREVNIKLLLNGLVKSSKLTLSNRNKLLVKMADDVAKLVLRDNFIQNISISLALAELPGDIGLYQRFIDDQEKQGYLDREIEFLPMHDIISERAISGAGLTRPEMSILISYSKNILQKQLISAPLPNNAYYDKFVAAGFPQEILNLYAPQMYQHYLRKEIIATMLSNAIVSELGITFANELQQTFGVGADRIANAFVIVREIFGFAEIFELIYTHESDFLIEFVIKLVQRVQSIYQYAIRWVLRNGLDEHDMSKIVKNYGSLLSDYKSFIKLYWDSKQKHKYKQTKESLLAGGLSIEASENIAITVLLNSSMNAVHAAVDCGAKLNMFMSVFFGIAKKLSLDWLIESMDNFNVDSHWAIICKISLETDFERCHRFLAESVYGLAMRVDADELHVQDVVDQWLDMHKIEVGQWKNILLEMRTANLSDFAVFSVALRQLSLLTDAAKKRLNA